MAKGFFSRILDFVGIEEETLEDDIESVNMDTEDSADFYDEPPVEEEPAVKGRRGKLVDLPTNNSPTKMIVYQPDSYEETQIIIDHLKARRTVVLNLESLELETAQRMLDFIGGAVYALSGNIFKVSRGIYIIAPSNVNISGNIADEYKGRGLYNLGGAKR